MCWFFCFSCVNDNDLLFEKLKHQDADDVDSETDDHDFFNNAAVDTKEHFVDLKMMIENFKFLF